MVLEYLQQFQDVAQRQVALNSLYESIIDKHNILRMAIEMECRIVATYVGFIGLHVVQKQFEELAGACKNEN